MFLNNDNKSKYFGSSWEKRRWTNGKGNYKYKNKESLTYTSGKWNIKSLL